MSWRVVWKTCRGCGRKLAPPSGDGLCVAENVKWRILNDEHGDNAEILMEIPARLHEDTCTGKWMKWMPPAVAARVNGTKLDSHERAVAIDQWLELRRT